MANGALQGIAIENEDAPARMVNVTASAIGSNLAFRINSVTYLLTLKSPTLLNVTATAHGPYGNYAISSDGWNVPTMTNVTATASGGPIRITGP